MILSVKSGRLPLRCCASDFRSGEAEQIFSVESLCQMSVTVHSGTCHDGEVEAGELLDICCPGHDPFLNTPV